MSFINIFIINENIKKMKFINENDPGNEKNNNNEEVFHATLLLKCLKCSKRSR